MKLRAPSIDPGVTSFLWAFGLALYLWLFMLAVGVDGATAAILAALSFFAIFLFVRLRGEEELPPYRARRARRDSSSR
jgi:amino acid permease